MDFLVYSWSEESILFQVNGILKQVNGIAGQVNDILGSGNGILGLGNGIVRSGNGIAEQDNGIAEQVNGVYTRGVSNDYTGTNNGINNFTRFGVVNSANIILPLTILNLKAYLQNNIVNVGWTSVEETNIDHYEVERASDGSHFSILGKVAAAKTGALKIDYKFADVQPLTGNNYYRIAAFDNSGKKIYSNTVLVRNTNTGTSNINVFPNPVTNSVANLQYNAIKEGNYLLVLYSSNGQKVWQTTILHPGGNASYLLTFPASLAKGAYHLEVKGEGISNTKTIIIQ